jgi:circadian clock protein KaiB
MCEEYLKGRYELEVIDIYQDPEQGGEADIVAAPTLIKRLPGPLRRLIGDMSDENRVLLALDIFPGGKKETKQVTRKRK